MYSIDNSIVLIFDPHKV